ncbi:MAG: UbiA family prenyltransferase [Bacteroidota bacterium]
MKKSTFLHLRIPFSYFLLPVFLFAWAIEPSVDWIDFWLVFIILHFLLYPASNVYNSYFDRDEKSIGGLKHPPKVSKEMYYYALLFDGLAILLGIIFINFSFAWMLLVYGLASKAYSHPSIRLKKYPWISWWIAGFFQGYFTFLMTYVGLHGGTLESTFTTYIQIPALLSSILLWGAYPMTQIYQHEEDRRRGDQTLSLRLGVLGTFHFVAIAFSVAAIAYFTYFYHYFNTRVGIFYLFSLLPVLAFFAYWYLKTRKNEGAANFKNTMRLNLISASLLNIFFTLLAFTKYNI